jgi:hypothetical protein
MADPNPKDKFSAFRTELDSPGQFAIAVTPDDDAVLNVSIRGLYIGVTGDVNCRPTGTSNSADTSANVIFKNATAGTILPVRLEAVWATSTTATDLVGLY